MHFPARGFLTITVVVFSVSASPPWEQSASQTRYSPNRNFSIMTHAVADRVRAIIAVGDSKGMKANRFMKIGDSITKNACFLGEFVCIDDTAKGGNHKEWEYVRNLGDYGYLRDAVEYFRRDTLPRPDALGDAYYFQDGTTYRYHVSCYNRISLTAEVGVRADWPFGGTPSRFSREIAEVSPGLAIIMYGANDMGFFGDTYRDWKVFSKNMLALVDSCIARGIVPVVTASCPRLDRMDASMTAGHICRCIAQERQVPFINFFRAAMVLPNHGMGGDGVHPASYGYNKNCRLTAEGLRHGFTMRNLITMQALDNIYRVTAGNQDSVDAPSPALAGSGTPTDPFVIDTLAFVDFRCVTERNPACYYRLNAAGPIAFRGLVVYQGSAAFSIELFDGAMTAVAAKSGQVERPLESGTYYIKINLVSGGNGEYQFIAMDRNDTGLPAVAENALLIASPALARSK